MRFKPCLSLGSGANTLKLKKTKRFMIKTELLFNTELAEEKMKKLITTLASLAFALGTTLAVADNHAAPSAPVGMVYGVNVSNPQAFASAMDKYWSSPTGKKIPGIAILRQVVAAGESPISHMVSVLHPSYEAMDAAFAINASSEDWATLLAELNGVSEIVSSSMFEGTGLGSMANQVGAGPGVANLYVLISVSDPAKYAEAWQKMIDGTDLGETDTVLIRMSAGGLGSTNHVAAVSGKSVGAVMAQMNANRSEAAFQTFLEEVRDIRTIEQNIVTIDMAVFGNTGG